MNTMLFYDHIERINIIQYNFKMIIQLIKNLTFASQSEKKK